MVQEEEDDDVDTRVIGMVMVHWTVNDDVVVMVHFDGGQPLWW